MEKTLIIQMMLGIIIGGGLGALLGYFGKCPAGKCYLMTHPMRSGLFGIIIGAIFILTVTTLGSSADTSKSKESANATESESTPKSMVRHIASVADFEDQVLGAELPVLVDFYSDFCQPCRMLGPTIEKLAELYHGRALVCKVNVSHLPQLADSYEIRGIPAVLFFEAGNEKGRLLGLRSEQHYTFILDKLTN